MWGLQAQSPWPPEPDSHGCSCVGCIPTCCGGVEDAVWVQVGCSPSWLGHGCGMEVAGALPQLLGGERENSKMVPGSQEQQDRIRLQKWCPLVSLSLERIPTGFCLSEEALILVIVSHSHVFQVLFKLLPLRQVNRANESACTPIKVTLHSLDFYDFPGCNPHWFSKQDILAACLCRAGPRIWGCLMQGMNPCFLMTSSVFLRSLPIVDCPMWSKSVSLPLLPVSMWLFQAMLQIYCSSSFQVSFKNIIPYVAVDVLCLWEEVSSGFSHTVILNPFASFHEILYVIFSALSRYRSGIGKIFLQGPYCKYIRL